MKEPYYVKTLGPVSLCIFSRSFQGWTVGMLAPRCAVVVGDTSLEWF